MLSARGRSLLFADADGATKFSDIEKLEDALSATIAEHWVGFCKKSAPIAAFDSFRVYTDFHLLFFPVHFV